MPDNPEQAPPAQSGMSGVISGAVTALKPYGPTPIVTVVIGGLGLIALAVGAPPLATVALVAISFGAYFIGQERKAAWARSELEALYDGVERRETASARINLERRLQLPGNQVQGTVGNEQGVGR